MCLFWALRHYWIIRLLVLIVLLVIQIEIQVDHVVVGVQINHTVTC